jgi:hypothetical protein
LHEAGDGSNSTLMAGHPFRFDFYFFSCGLLFLNWLQLLSYLSSELTTVSPVALCQNVGCWRGVADGVEASFEGYELTSY